MKFKEAFVIHHSEQQQQKDTRNCTGAWTMQLVSKSTLQSPSYQ
jgi:hypothetical protein